MTPAARHHVVLVPGFAAFDMLGPVDYYHGVVDVFRQPDQSLPSCGLHTFANVPSASVATRARMLGHWLAEHLDRGAIQPDDAIHLVGHSTGGLDIRQLLRELDDAGTRRPYRDVPVTAAAILDRVRSVQFLSTPHRGTNLARVVYEAMPMPQLLVRGIFLALHRAGPHLTVSLAHTLGKLRSKPAVPHLGDAALDTLRSAGSLGDGFERARSRGVFYALMRWLNEMGTDFSAIGDLRPVVPGRPTPAASPIYRSDDDREQRLYDQFRTRSIVTIAEPNSGGGLDLFQLLDRLMRHHPPDTLGAPCSLRLLGAADEVAEERVERTHHDGVVNSVSMVWPDPARSWLVHADHGDIIGHYGGGGDDEDAGYDLLPTATPFDRASFTAVWQDIRRFALTC